MRVMYNGPHQDNNEEKEMPDITNMWPKVINWKQKRRWGKMKKMRTPVANIHEMKIEVDKILNLRDKGEAVFVGIEQ